MLCCLAICLVGLASISTAQTEPSSPAIMSITMCDVQLSSLERAYKVRQTSEKTKRRVAEAAEASRAAMTETIQAFPSSLFATMSSTACSDNIEIMDRTFRSANGRCNNVNNPSLGESFEKFRRFVATRYEDDACLARATGESGNPLPKPRDVSLAIHPHEDEFEDLSILIMQWGQFMDHDLDAAAVEQPAVSEPCCTDPIFLAGNPHPDEAMCGGKCIPIRIDSNDTDINTTCMENIRSRSIQDIQDISSSNKREQQNLITSFVDASNVYGSDAERMDALRDGVTPFMKTSPGVDGGLLPEGLLTDCITSANAPFCFAAGDERVHVFAGLTALHTIFVRLHNLVATELDAHTSFSNDRVFYETRKIIGAILQEITYFHWLPLILNKNTRGQFGLLRNQYTGYNATIDPSISNAFAASAFRFGHSLIPSNLTLGNEVFLTRNIFNNPEFIFANNGRGLRRVMKAITKQPALESDRFLTSEITNHLFETHTTVFDLASLNILRGRDHGIGTFNDARVACGLTPLTSFDPAVLGEAAVKLEAVYESVNDIDLFAGGMSEPNLPGARLGETFSCIIADQFSNSRFGDRFWYETEESGLKFTEAQREAIRFYTIDQIFCDTVKLNKINRDPFFVVNPDSNKTRKCKGQFLRLNLQPWIKGNEA